MLGHLKSWCREGPYTPYGVSLERIHSSATNLILFWNKIGGYPPPPCPYSPSKQKQITAEKNRQLGGKSIHEHTKQLISHGMREAGTLTQLKDLVERVRSQSISVAQVGVQLSMEIFQPTRCKRLKWKLWIAASAPRKQSRQVVQMTTSLFVRKGFKRGLAWFKMGLARYIKIQTCIYFIL